MKPILKRLLPFLVSVPILLAGCGESSYNDSTLDPNMNDEYEYNVDQTTHTEHWKKMTLNPSGSVKSTNLITEETIEAGISSDETGQSDDFDFTVTLTELTDGTFTADGAIYISDDLTFRNSEGEFLFINLPVAFEINAESSQVKQCVITGDSPVSTMGTSTHSYIITLRKGSDINYYCDAQITDNVNDVLIDAGVTIIRSGGNGAYIAFADINYEDESEQDEADETEE